MDSITERPPVRVGIIGIGRTVLLNHLKAIQALTELYTVTAVCDLIKERRDRVERLYPNLHPYRRYEDMLDDPDIDLVFIALPTVHHVKVALASLAKRKWTVLESPLALSHEQALVLRAASLKVHGRLFPCLPGYFAPDFRLARMALGDSRLGDVYEAIIRRQDYVRRDDWQSVKRCGGGAVWYDGPNAVQQAVTLLGAPPGKLWSELKRVVSLGDAEDTAHIVIKGRNEMTVSVDICGARLARPRPSFEIYGSRGMFMVMPGASEGIIRAIDPAFKFKRRRSSVRTPPLVDLHEEFPVQEYPIRLPDTEDAAVGYWRALYESVRKAMPFPVPLDDAVETIRYLQLARQTSPFAK